MEKKMTLAQAAKQVVSALDAPISEEEFIERVFEIYPTKAKTPTSSLKNTLRFDLDGEVLIYLDKEKIIPLNKFISGVRIRIPVDGQMAGDGYITADALQPFYPGWRYWQKEIFFQNKNEEVIPTKSVTIKLDIPEDVPGIFTRDEAKAYEILEWFIENDVQEGDSIIVTAKRWDPFIGLLECEKRQDRRQEKIEAFNKEFADTLFDLLENSRDERIYVRHALPKVYALLSDPYGYPGDHWRQILEKDGRMLFTGFDITYADMYEFDPFEPFSDEQLSRINKNYDENQAGIVYRFKAFPEYTKKIWREIEIRGNQTLSTLDSILRDAFQHDPDDHLGGFWKRVPRGNTKRFREVDLGTINPFEEGDGAEIRIGSLDLKVGDQLKYVYDFGDWLEHFLALEETSAVQKGIEYPRIVAQNKPRYRYCPSCKEKGKKTIATMLCIECSNRQQKDIEVCENCFDEKHEEHYGVEILY